MCRRVSPRVGPGWSRPEPGTGTQGTRRRSFASFAETETRLGSRRRGASPPRGTLRGSRGGRSRPGPCPHATRTARRERSRRCARGRTGSRTRREAPTPGKKYFEYESSSVLDREFRHTPDPPTRSSTREAVFPSGGGRRLRARRSDARPRRGARAGGTGTSARGTKTRWRARRRRTRARPRRGFEGRVVRRARPRVQTRRAKWRVVVGERGARRRRPSPRGGVARRRRRGREPRRRYSRRTACRTWAWSRRRRCEERRRCSPARKTFFRSKKSRQKGNCKKQPRLARSSPDAHACDAPACRRAAADARARTRSRRARRRPPPPRAVSVSS